MRHLLTAGAAALALGLPAAGQATPDPQGIWLTEKERAAVKLEPCSDGQGMCGTVWWLEPDGELVFDKHNPDPEKRSRPMCGMTVLWGFEKDGGRKWEDGKLYKPDEGKVYNAFFKLKDPDRMKVSGYIGFEFISKSQTWTRTSADAHPKCETPDEVPASLEAEANDDSAPDRSPVQARGGK
ncbi:Uncharacterized conserved protein, DUF2147 family [Limimonas halophila]|uniref:Uncharacterized conserved protein, DUF2147 family n=1 Tax=Limimonas halophila TaxID=1082479 RepID=A0A1G7UYN6_9PROT|nr:DUF2147 domain-containing protein [Limimonas halophila]SDG52401.1 Uncharacterized conserved protein, DUF2147 family [Limimonas halophila]